MVVSCQVCFKTNFQDQLDLEYHTLHAHGREAYLILLKGEKDVSSIISQVTHDISRLQTRFKDQIKPMTIGIPEVSRLNADEYKVSTARKLGEPRRSSVDDEVVFDIHFNIRNHSQEKGVTPTKYLHPQTKTGRPCNDITSKQSCNIKSTGSGGSRYISSLYIKSNPTEIQLRPCVENKPISSSSLRDAAARKRDDEFKSRRLVSEAQPLLGQYEYSFNDDISWNEHMAKPGTGGKETSSFIKPFDREEKLDSQKLCQYPRSGHIMIESDSCIATSLKDLSDSSEGQAVARGTQAEKEIQRDHRIKQSVLGNSVRINAGGHERVMMKDADYENKELLCELQHINNACQVPISHQDSQRGIQQQISTNDESKQEWTGSVAEKLGNNLISYMDKTTNVILKKFEESVSKEKSNWRKIPAGANFVTDQKVPNVIGVQDLVEREADLSQFSCEEQKDGMLKGNEKDLNKIGNFPNQEIATSKFSENFERKKIKPPGEFQEKYFKQRNELRQTKNRLQNMLEKFREISVERQQFDDILQQYVQSAEGIQERLQNTTEKMKQRWKENNDLNVKIQDTLSGFEKRIGKELCDFQDKHEMICEELKQIHQTEIVHLQKLRDEEIDIYTREISVLRHQVLNQKQQSVNAAYDSKGMTVNKSLYATEDFQIINASHETVKIEEDGDCGCKLQPKRSRSSTIRRLFFGCFSSKSTVSKHKHMHCIYVEKYHRALMETEKSNDRIYKLECDLLEVTHRQNELIVREEQLTFDLESYRRQCLLKDEQLMDMKKHIERLVVLTQHNTNQFNRPSVMNKSPLFNCIHESFDRLINDLQKKMYQVLAETSSEYGITRQQEEGVTDLISDLKSQICNLKIKLMEEGKCLSQVIAKCTMELSKDQSDDNDDDRRQLRDSLEESEAKSHALKDIVINRTLQLERMQKLINHHQVNDLETKTQNLTMKPVRKDVCLTDCSTQTTNTEQHVYKKLFKVLDTRRQLVSHAEDEFHGQESLNRSQSLSSIYQNQAHLDRNTSFPSVDMDYVDVLKKRLNSVSDELKLAVSEIKDNKCALEKERVVIEELQNENEQLKNMSTEKDSTNKGLQKKLDSKNNMLEKLKHELKNLEEQKCKSEDENNLLRLQTQNIQTSFDKYKSQVAELESKHTCKENLKSFREIGVVTDENAKQFEKNSVILQDEILNKQKKITDYQKKVKQLQKVITDYDCKRHDIQIAFEEKVQESVKLSQTIDSLKEKVNEMERLHSECFTRCSNYEKDVTEKKEKICELKSMNADLQNRLTQLKDYQTESDEKYQMKEKKHRQNEKEHISLKKSCNDLKEEISYLKQQYDSNQDQLSQTINGLDLLKQKNLQIQNDKRNLEKQIKNLEESLGSSEDKIMMLRRQTGGIDNAPTKTYRELGTETDDSMYGMHGENVSLQSEIERKDGVITSHVTEIESLRDQLHLSKNKIKEAEKSFKDQILETKKLQQTNESQYQKMRELAKYCNESQARCDNLEKNVAAKDNKITELTQQISELNQQLKLSKECNENEDDVKTLRLTIDEQNVKMMEMAKICNESEITIGNFAEEVTAKDEEISQLIKRNDDLEEEIEILKQKVPEKDQVAVKSDCDKELTERSLVLLQELEDKNIKVERELSSVEKENRELREDLEKNATEKQEIESVLQNVKDKNLQFENELDIFKSKNSKLLTEFDLVEEKNKSLLKEKQSLEIKCAKLIAENRKPSDCTKKNKEDEELISHLEVQVAGLIKERKNLLAQVDDMVCENEMLKEHIKRSSQENRCLTEDEDLEKPLKDTNIPIKRTDSDFDVDSPDDRDRYYLSAEEECYSSSVIEEMEPKPSFPLVDLNPADQIQDEQYHHENKADNRLRDEQGTLPKRHSLPLKPVLQPITSIIMDKNLKDDNLTPFVSGGNINSNVGVNKLLTESTKLDQGLSPLPPLTPIATNAAVETKHKEVPPTISPVGVREESLKSPAKVLTDIPVMQASRGLSPFKPLSPINPIKSVDKFGAENANLKRSIGLGSTDVKNGSSLWQSSPRSGGDLSRLEEIKSIQPPLALDKQIKGPASAAPAESFASLVKPNPILQRSSGLPLSTGLTPIVKSPPPSLPTPKGKFQLQPLEPLEQLGERDKPKKDKGKKKKKKGKKEMIVNENAEMGFSALANQDYHQMALRPVRNMRPGSSAYTPAAILQLASQRQYQQALSGYYGGEDQYFNDASGYYDGHIYEEGEPYAGDNGFYSTEHAYYQIEDDRRNAYYQRNNGVYYVDDTIIDL